MKEFCSRCGGIRDGSHYSWCRKCVSSYTKDRERNDPEYRERRREHNRKYRARIGLEGRRILNRRSNLKGDYGLTIAQFDELLLSQGSKCAICAVPQVETTTFHVDHCHSTGRNRGLLCSNCNHLLGKAKDSPAILQKAIDYLRLHTELSCSIFENGAAPVR